MQRQDRARHELAEVGEPTVDVATEIVGVVLLHGRRAHDVSLDDAVTEAGSESFDLRLDGIGHVDRRTVGDMAVPPTGLPTLGRAGAVELAGLPVEDVGALAVTTA